MRIAFVVGTLGAGGAERVVALLGDALVSCGHQVLVITLAGQGKEDFHQVHPNVERADLSAGRRVGINPLANMRRLLALRRAIRKYRAQVVISFITQANILSLVALLGTGVPVIISERIDPRVHRERWIWRLLRRVTYRWASRLVVQTHAVRPWARSIVDERAVAVIPNPVVPLSGPAVATGWESRNFIGAAGRFVPQKGFDLLIRAFASIRERHRDLKLLILGDGPQREALEGLARQLGVQDRVSLPGIQEEPFQVLRHARVFVLSSRYEGFPNVLLEAMSCGLPVVSFDCPSGPAEIIRDRENGLLVAAEDIPALAAAIDRLLEDSAMRHRLGTAATEVTERFASERIVQCWLQLLEGTTR